MSKKNRETDRAARAAAAMAEQQREERRRRNLMVGSAIGVVLLIVVIGFIISRSLDTTSDVDAPAAGSEFGLTIGPDDAPNEVVVYEDFLCPYCGQFESASRDDFAQLAADGKVQIEYRPFNFLNTDYSARAAGAFSIVLDKAGADVAKKFHDLLYENQPEESGPFPSDDDIIQLAVQAGAKESDVSAAIQANDGKAWVEKATASASDAGVSATPTILLNGEVFQDGRTVSDLVRNLLAKLQ
jgi:protein-disulfide isomerase